MEYGSSGGGSRTWDVLPSVSSLNATSCVDDFTAERVNSTCALPSTESSRLNWVRFANSSYPPLLLPLFQTHPRASAVLVDELDVVS